MSKYTAKEMSALDFDPVDELEHCQKVAGRYLDELSELRREHARVVDGLGKLSAHYDSFDKLAQRPLYFACDIAALLAGKGES